MAMEALSHAGHLGKNLLVILNDNEMSIAPNIGALARYSIGSLWLTLIREPKKYVVFCKEIVGERVTRTIQDLEKSVKGSSPKVCYFRIRF